MGIIYCLTSPSGKKYIGQTKRDMEKRFREHCRSDKCIFLSHAIKKYGSESFTKEILITCDDNLLDFYEKFYIKTCKTLCPDGYNVRTGGNDGLYSDDSKEKMRQSKLGAKNPNYGKPRSEETKRLISEKKKGSSHHFFGKELSLNHKLNLSKSHKKDNGIPMYICKIAPRPKCYQAGGYMVDNHPFLKTKYFTSKKYTDEEKYNMALAYLNYHDTNAVQRLNDNGRSNSLKI